MTGKTDSFTGQRWHDMGGTAAGPIPSEEHDFALWEKRVDALLVIASSKGHFTVDGLRRVLEDMGEDAFEHVLLRTLDRIRKPEPDRSRRLHNFRARRKDVTSRGTRLQLYGEAASE